ncbi:GTPase Era, mitochondrial-like [Paramacrobiotus metropolitanus]|uniref:GTPase Era, mitochondrial-like n=1 Tax=Paramacrobiotus metropolitanus TaxID=2943436 RepID=UPI0024459508|nr:GTPase Era, mitochondrial-like [Paramacrobiotus metropolitanus]
MSIRSGLSRLLSVRHRLREFYCSTNTFEPYLNLSMRFPLTCGVCRSYSQNAYQNQDDVDFIAEELEFDSTDLAVPNAAPSPARTEQFSSAVRSEHGKFSTAVSTEHVPSPSAMWDRRVPLSVDEYKSLTLRPTEQVVNPRYLRVSIIGSPNAGKSTLTNQILGWRVSSVSAKVHTTRRNTLAIMTEENVQLVLVDTPGIVNPKHAKKHHLERSLVTDPGASLLAVDVVAVIVDASQPYSERTLDPLILHMLYSNPYLECILILNKVDRIKKKSKLLEMANVLTCGVVDSVKVQRHEPVESYLSRAQKGQLKLERATGLRPAAADPEATFWDDVEAFGKMEWFEDKRRFVEERCGWPKFKEVFMISALDGDGIEELKSYLMKTAHAAEWRFNPELVSNQSPREIVLMAVREKLLEHLRFQLPYQVELFLKEWQVDDRGTLRLSVQVKCPKKSDMKYVVGENGRRIREIAYEAGQEMMNTFRCEVLLRLIVTFDLFDCSYEFFVAEQL